MIQTLLLNGLELIDRFLVRETKGAVGSVELVYFQNMTTGATTIWRIMVKPNLQSTI